MHKCIRYHFAHPPPHVHRVNPIGWMESSLRIRGRTGVRLRRGVCVCVHVRRFAKFKVCLSDIVTAKVSNLKHICTNIERMYITLNDFDNWRLSLQENTLFFSRRLPFGYISNKYKYVYTSESDKIEC